MCFVVGAWCGLVGVGWCGWGGCWCVLVGVRVLVVSDAHVFLFLSFSWFCFFVLSCLVWLITGCLGFWCVGWVLGCLFSCADRPTVFVFGVLSVGSGGGWLVFVLCARSLVVVVCAFLGGWSCCWAGLVVCLGGLLGCSLFVGSCVCAKVCAGVWLRVCGERGCLGGFVAWLLRVV